MVRIYYDKKGKLHTVEVIFRNCRYEIYLDNKYYASADDRLDADDSIKELVADKKFSTEKPQEKTSPKSLATTGEVN